MKNNTKEYIDMDNKANTGTKWDIYLKVFHFYPLMVQKSNDEKKSKKKNENWKKNWNKAISMMRGKSPRSDVEMSKKTKFRGGHLGFLTGGFSQSILTKLGTNI